MQLRMPWWALPATVVTVLGGFTVYIFFRIFENDYYTVGNYISPVVSPNFYEIIPGLHALVVAVVAWINGVAGLDVPAPTAEATPILLGFIPLNAAVLVLALPLTFRMTCYYYRKAIYRSFMGDPGACARPEVVESKHYKGESAFPFVAMNLHRYFFYGAVFVLIFLWWDTLLAFGLFRPSGFEVNLGSLVFLVNAVFLSAYTFGCHAFRHLVGGGADCYSCGALDKTKYGAWRKVTFLNEKHAMWAWLSLFSVVSVDLFVRFVAAGVISDVRLI